jgi:hypothetical protein
LTDEALYNQSETEFLICNLSPKKEFEEETFNRMSLLNGEQINVLKKFLSCLLKDKYWQECCPEDIRHGIYFLDKMLTQRSSTG